LRSCRTQLEESYAWGKFVVWLTANCTPASSCWVAWGRRVLHSINIVDDNGGNEGVVAIVPERDIKIVGNGNKPCVWQLERYLVHKLVLVALNDSRCVVFSSSSESRSDAIVSIDSRIMKSGTSEFPKIRLRLICNRSKVTLFLFELHSWKLGTYLGVRVFLFVVK
jgi:hypothetical protein